MIKKTNKSNKDKYNNNLPNGNLPASKSISKAILSLLILTLIFTALISLLYLTDFIGYVSYLPAEAGNVTKIIIPYFVQSSVWQGFYGIVVTDPRVNSTQFASAVPGGLTKRNIVFPCLDAQRQLFASSTPYSKINMSSLRAGNITYLENWLGYLPHVLDSATRTLTQNYFNITTSRINITNIPSTYTYKDTGNATSPNKTIFDLGFLTDMNNNIIFATHIKSSISTGFSTSVVNYQIMVPVNSSQLTYYFFSDPDFQCPLLGSASYFNGTIVGYVIDNATKLPLPNISISVAGIIVQTNQLGFYNITTIEGTHNLVGFKGGYSNHIALVNITQDNETEHNFSMGKIYTIPNKGIIQGNIRRYSNLLPLDDVLVSVGGTSAVTGITGSYNISAEAGNYYLIAIKTGFDNFVQNVTITVNNATTLDFEMNETVFGEIIKNGTVTGMVFDNTTLLPLPNATVSLNGVNKLTDSAGNYSITASAGASNIIATKAGYLNTFKNITLVGNSTIYVNLSLEQQPLSTEFISNLRGAINGSVLDKETLKPIENVIVSLAGESNTTTINGLYSLSALNGTYKIVAIKFGYENYIADVNIVADNLTNYNILMELFTPSTQENVPILSGVGAGAGSGAGAGAGVGKGIAPRVEKPGEQFRYLLSIPK